jgi:2-polyprenyl-3-methyl-5-hydroxy-6-metoxy-1,4-benzoquinol methylase
MIACPRDRTELDAREGGLECRSGHRYPCVDGIPVLLLEEVEPTHAACWKSPARARVRTEPAAAIDRYVSRAVEKTCGGLYRPLVGQLEVYPIPELPLPRAEGARLLDVGCNWGRWSLSAARKGYSVVGIDPSLDAIAAARRVAAQVGHEIDYVVADARHLPFADASFDVVFSYSVIQHFAKADVLRTLDELHRVLRPGGRALVQMANALGPRNLYLQLRRRRFREPRALFDVRYWSPRELLDAFARIGPSRLSADGFFALNAQPSDLPLLPLRYRPLVRASEVLRRVPLLRFVADSVWIDAVRAA